MARRAIELIAAEATMLPLIEISVKALVSVPPPKGLMATPALRDALSRFQIAVSDRSFAVSTPVETLPVKPRKIAFPVIVLEALHALKERVAAFPALGVPARVEVLTPRVVAQLLDKVLAVKP